MKTLYTAASLVLLMALAGCSRSDPETRLRERIDAMQQALEERRIGDFMDGVAEDFSGSGAGDYRGLNAYLRAHALRNASIGVTRGPTEVEIIGDRATVRFEAVATGGAGGLLPERAGAWRVTSGWQERDGEWVVYRADWERIASGR